MKDFTAKLRIPDQKHFMCWISILLQTKYFAIMYVSFFFGLFQSLSFKAKGIIDPVVVYMTQSANLFVMLDKNLSVALTL